MDIYVYSRSALGAVRPHEVPHIIISITSGPEDVAKLRTTTTCRGVLRLFFPDADAPSEQFTEDSLFSHAHAIQIWQFVNEHRPHIDRIVIHCDAGISRSPAVAAAISRVLKGDDTEYFSGRYRPNPRVYRLLLETYRASD